MTNSYDFLDKRPSAQEVNHLHSNSDKDSALTAQHHTLGSRRTQASPGDHIHDGKTSRILPAYLSTLSNVKKGTVSVSFNTLNSYAAPVVFPGPAFTTVPLVFVNINSGDASTGRWYGRAYGISTTGFNLWLTAPNTTNATWANVPVQWIAIAI